MDRDAAKIAALTRGEVPIHEPGLDDLLARNTAAGRIRFTGSLADALAGADAVIVAVGTPVAARRRRADLTYVRAAAQDIARVATGPLAVVIKSTVPVGTNREVAQLLRETRPDLDLPVASNPEFLREGAAIGDFMRPRPRRGGPRTATRAGAREVMTATTARCPCAKFPIVGPTSNRRG
jgi:UDPglucose 6-dehydrogenase